MVIREMLARGKSISLAKRRNILEKRRQRLAPYVIKITQELLESEDITSKLEDSTTLVHQFLQQVSREIPYYEGPIQEIQKKIEDFFNKASINKKSRKYRSWIILTKEYRDIMKQLKQIDVEMNKIDRIIGRGQYSQPQH